jgi:hypothetical protein
MEARPESRGAGRRSNGELLNLFLTKAAPEFRREGQWTAGSARPDDNLKPTAGGDGPVARSAGQFCFRSALTFPQEYA